MKCSICEKKQSPFIQDFPLCEQAQEIRICANCHELIEKTKRMVDNPIEFPVLRESLIAYIERENISGRVRDYLNGVISDCDKLFQPVYQKYERQQEIILAEEAAIEEKQSKIFNLMLTNGFNFEGYKIKEYIKVISGENVLGTGFLSELSANFADIAGKESERFTSKLEQVKDNAIYRLCEQAADLNANAIIGVNFNYINFSGNVIGIVVSGTAVRIEKIDI